MKQHVKIEEKNPFGNALEEVLREGARKMLQQAIENEVTEFIREHQQITDEKGHQLVTRNGYQPCRWIQTGIGPIEVRKPRVKSEKEEVRFSSAILPRYMRRVPSLDALIPALYLKGIATSDFPEALKAILGEGAQGLSPTNIARLKESWEEEYQEWQERSLEGKQYVYIWADGIYFNVRLDKDRPCLLVLIGATLEGKKEILAIHDGIRESKISWKEVLQDLKKRGLEKSPSLAIGDGALGFWGALEEEFPACQQQRCWVHKTANILDKLPKSVQGSAKKAIHEIYLAPNKKKAEEAFQRFLNLYEAKYPKACECLQKDLQRLLTFYDYPAEHWQHIRTTNPIESTFATIRHRTRQTKGCGSRIATLTMVYKLMDSAEKHWRRLKGSTLIGKVVEGIKFKDGEEEKNQEKVA